MTRTASLSPAPPLTTSLTAWRGRNRYEAGPDHFVCRSNRGLSYRLLDPQGHGKINSADKLYLVIESVKPDNKHEWDSDNPVTARGAGRRSVD
jgi:hypothetical protein